ncbi:hypothetical protein [Yersinia enterocolitica]|nr:hypothetical protein [Yersinia enterocolitica]HEI6819264.1 hypothetical protein [Yersinia enterocolitica]
MEMKNSGLIASGQTRAEIVPQWKAKTHNAETLYIPKGFTGRYLVHIDNGKIKSNMPLTDIHFCTTLVGFAELLIQAGYTVISQEEARHA